MMEDRPRNDPDPLHNLGMPVEDVRAAKQQQMAELEKAEEYLEKIEVEHPDRGIFRKSLLGYELKKVVVGYYPLPFCSVYFRARRSQRRK